MRSSTFWYEVKFLHFLKLIMRIHPTTPFLIKKKKLINQFFIYICLIFYFIFVCEQHQENNFFLYFKIKFVKLFLYIFKMLLFFMVYQTDFFLLISYLVKFHNHRKMKYACLVVARLEPR